MPIDINRYNKILKDTNTFKTKKIKTFIPTRSTGHLGKIYKNE